MYSNINQNLHYIFEVYGYFFLKYMDTFFFLAGSKELCPYNNIKYRRFLHDSRSSLMHSHSTVVETPKISKYLRYYEYPTIYFEYFFSFCDCFSNFVKRVGM